MKEVYGYINHSGAFVEVGFTERGAKVAATRRGYEYTEVGYRSTINNMFIKTSTREVGKWWAN